MSIIERATQKLAHSAFSKAPPPMAKPSAATATIDNSLS